MNEFRKQNIFFSCKGTWKRNHQCFGKKVKRLEEEQKITEGDVGKQKNKDYPIIFSNILVEERANIELAKIFSVLCHFISNFLRKYMRKLFLMVMMLLKIGMNLILHVLLLMERSRLIFNLVLRSKKLLIWSSLSQQLRKYGKTIKRMNPTQILFQRSNTMDFKEK